MWTISVSHENKVDVHLEKELVKKRESERVHIKEDEDAEWGDAFLIGPLQNIVACAEDGESSWIFLLLGNSILINHDMAHFHLVIIKTNYLMYLKI